MLDTDSAEPHSSSKSFSPHINQSSVAPGIMPAGGGRKRDKDDIVYIFTYVYQSTHFCGFHSVSRRWAIALGGFYLSVALLLATGSCLSQDHTPSPRAAIRDTWSLLKPKAGALFSIQYNSQGSSQP